MKLLAVALVLSSALPALAAYDGPPAEKAKWIAFCIDSLKDTNEKKSTRRVYCRCHERFRRHRRFSPVYEWERMFPAGASCLLQESGLQAGRAMKTAARFSLLLAALALFQPRAAQACACCTNTAQRHVAVEKLDSGRNRGESRGCALPGKARVYLSDGVRRGTEGHALDRARNEYRGHVS